MATVQLSTTTVDESDPLPLIVETIASAATQQHFYNHLDSLNPLSTSLFRLQISTMRWNPFASPPPLPENLSLLDRVQDRLGRVQELANRELVTTRALLTDFQEFIQQGNMLNMAVGLILGSSFSAILNSLVTDILAPIISLFTARGIANNYWPLRCPSTTPQCSKDSWQTWKEARDAGAVTINYGLFIENIMNFVINALFLFFAVKKALEVVFKLKVGVKKQCPYCKEFVKGAATRCKECGSDIRTPPSAG